MVTLRKIVIHEIIKAVNSTTAGKYFAESVIDLKENPDATQLIEKVNKSYDDEEIVFSKFKDETLSNFPSQFDLYFNSAKTSKGFLTLTTKTLENLRLSLEKVQSSKGGYYVYAEYEFEAETYIGIFLIRDTEGVMFKRDNKSKGFKVDPITYMNIEKLAMGCRINVTRYSKKGLNYLTLIKKNQEVISDYFYDWISTANKESSREYTHALYEIISLLPPPIHAETKQQYTVDHIRKDILAYITEKNRFVDIRDIGKQFYGDSNIIVKYAKDNAITIDSSFKADRGGLRKFRHININSDGIKVQFSHGDFTSKKIRFAPENQNMVVIESEKFANALRRELDEYKINV